MKFSISRIGGKSKAVFLILMFLSTIVPAMLFTSPVKALFGTSFDKYAGNPLTTIPTYGASGVVHPDVVYFSGGMDGYKYWMVYTPYPPEAKENPSIVRSNDGITWTDAGITNPVIPEGTPGAWNDYQNPDPDFTYVRDYNKWFMIWDGGDYATDSRKLALAYSSDGKTWTQYDGAPVNGNPDPIILAGDDAEGQAWERAGSISKTSCPTLLYENGIFTLYYVEEASGNNNGQVGFATFTWNDSTHSVENLKRYSNNPTISIGCGHLDLSKRDNVYYLYAVKGSSLILFTSTDKISWTDQGTVLEGGDWDQSIYRSSATTDSSSGQIAIFDGKMKLYYSAFGNPQIGLATSKGPPAWYDQSWTRRKEITVTNSNPTSLAGYQVQINVDYDSDMKTDFSDLRFIDADGVTSIPYCIESYVNSVSAVVWVRIPYIPAAGSTAIYMYYGNPSATTLSDGSTTFELFDDFERGYGSGWTVNAPMPSPPKADGTAAVYNGKLYVFGGYDQTSSDPRAETYEYDPTTNTWTQKASMPTARWGPIAVEFNGKIYVFSGTATDVNEVYDPLSNTWETKRSLPSGFNQGLMGVRYGDKIDLFYHTLHYEYDPATDTYAAKAPMPTPRRWSTVAVVGNKIYVIGGYHNTYGAMNVNEVYDPATDTWTTRAPMPVSKYGTTRENPVIDGKIYVTHGLDGGFHTDNYVYDPSTDTWEQKSSATYPRDGVECGVINNVLYVVGGRADFVGPYGVNYNEEYDPSSDNVVLWSFSNPEEVKRDTSAKYEGNYGLMIYDDTSQSEYAEHTFTLPSLELDFYWDITNNLGEGAMQPQGRILFTDPSLSNYGSLYYYRDNDGVVKVVWYSGSYTVLTSGAWNTWYHVVVDWDGANSKVIINDVEYDVTATSATSDRVRLESSAMSEMYFDLVRVRKYTSPEPTVAIGAEETMPPPPVANFTWSPSGPKAREIVTFDGSSSTPGAGTIVSYEWDFGDGQTGAGNVADHTYSKKGNYIVSLKVTDSQGLWGAEQKQIQVASAPPSWLDASWTRRKPITIDNTLNPNELTDYQIRLTVDYDTHMKTDFSDLRFTDTDGVTLIPYWIENYNSSSAVVWVKVPDIPSSDTTIIYMYYDNPSASNAANGPSTFEFFEDFEAGFAVSAWTQKQQMPVPRSDVTAAVYSGKLYVFGGYDQSGNSKAETYVYDPSADTWTQRASMPTARWGPLAVEFNGLIYVFGGTASVDEVYDPTSDTWSTKNNLPSGFNQGLMGVKYGDTIQLFYQNLHYEYDPATDTYTRKADVPTWRTWGTCAVVGDKIYVIGGYSYGPSSSGAVDVNEVYDPATDTWTTKAPMPISKYGVTRENPVIDGKIYVTHGLDGSNFHTDNYVYDPSTDTWEQKSSAVYPRDGVACGVIDNKLYVVGGRADFVGPYGLVYNEEYDPSADTGASPTWVISDPGKVRRDSSAAYEGNYGLMVYQDVGTTPEYAEHSLNLATCAVDLCWDVTDALGITGVQPQGRILLADETNPALGSLYYCNDNGPKFEWYTGSFAVLQSGSWNTWYHITIVWNGANSKVVINGVQHSVSASTVNSDRVYLGTIQQTKTYFDLVRVRKYSSPEPTFSTGAEEALPPPPPPAPWYDVSWTRRKPINIVNTSPVSLTAYQVKINVTYDSDMKSDFSDLRFTDSDGATLLPYWVENYGTSTSATIWVRVSSVPASGTTTVYMYYDNPSALTTSNGDATFEFFDNFTGNTLNTTKWTPNAVNTITQTVNDCFRFQDATKSGGTYWIYGDSRGRIGSQDQANWTPLSQFVLEFRSSFSDTATSEMGEGLVGLVSNTNTIIGVAGYQDWMGLNYDSQRGVITENQASSLGSGVAKRGDSQYDAFKAVGTVDATSWKIIYDGSTLQVYDGDGFFASAPVSSTVSKVALAAGAYGGYPYLDYVQIDYMMVHKYAPSEPTVSVGGEQTFASTVKSCDSTGTLKDTFDQSETVYAFGTGYPVSTTFSVYVVNDVVVWTDGMTIPSRVSGTATTVSSNSSGIVPPTPVWSQLTPGKYDIIVDVNGNGKYDVGVDALDDNDVATTAGFQVTGKPTLNIDPTTATCRMFNETFAARINVTAADNIAGFKFEIHYNATLLDVSSVSWTAWGTGTYTADEANGILTGYSSGNTLNGDLTLVTINFNATYRHIWKDESKVTGWKNDQSGILYFQWANLSYTGNPDLSYVRGGTQNQINAGPDAAFTFSPIRGDINNDGVVDIYDLRTVAAYYNQHNSTYDLNGDGIIDVYDLVTVASNFGFEYP